MNSQRSGEGLAGLCSCFQLGIPVISDDQCPIVADSYYRDVWFDNESDDESESPETVEPDSVPATGPSNNPSDWSPDPRVQEELEAMYEGSGASRVLNSEKMARFGYTGRTENDTGMCGIIK